MSHYAMELKYNFDPDNNGEITEYFIPFSKSELLEFGLDNYIMNAIKKMDEHEYPLDDFRDNMLLRDNIVELDDNRIEALKEDNLKLIFGIAKYECFSTWDILSEANLMLFASENYRENREEVNELAEKTFKSQYDLLMLKIGLSLIAHFEAEEKSLRPEHENLDEIFNILVFCEKINNITEFNYNNNLAEIMQNRPNTSNNEIDELIRNILYLENLNLSDNLSDLQRETNYKMMKRNSDEIVSLEWNQYKDSYYFYAILEAMNLGGKRQGIRRKHDINLLRDFLSSRDNYRHDRVEEKIKNCVNSCQQNMTIISSGNVNQNNIIWNDFSNFFGSDKSSSSIKKKYAGKNCGCFAIMITDLGKNYFSLSGMTEELKGRNSKWVNQVKYIMEHILNKVPAPDIFAQNYKFNYAFIHTGLDVRRYTEVVKDKTDYIGKIGPYLNGITKYETYDKDIKWNPGENYNFTYSCCERKMLAYSGYDHALEIYSRWAPCWKCCPAILDAPKVKVYAFFKLSDYINQSVSTQVKLKEYKVTNLIAYSVEEV